MLYVDPDAPLISFSVSVKIHNVCGILLTVNYLVFIIGNRLSGNGEHYRTQWKGARERLMKQARYYLFGYFKGEEPPFPINEARKFNPLQAFTYAMAMYVGVPVVAFTGWGLLFPEVIPDRILGLSGLVTADILHITAGFLLSIFMIIHIYICTIGSDPKGNFRAIMTGWHSVDSH
jgi:thiosulfate reductase cytochrome b subunit